MCSFHSPLSDGLPVLTLRWRSRGVGPVVMLAVHLPDVSPSTEASTVVAPRPWGPHGGVRLAPAGVHWSTVGLTQGRPRLLWRRGGGEMEEADVSDDSIPASITDFIHMCKDSGVRGISFWSERALYFAFCWNSKFPKE